VVIPGGKMGENRTAIEMKKQKLKEELNSDNPNRCKIRRLEKSIARHKCIDKGIRNSKYMRKHKARR
jgi:hypothetical protein